MGGAGGLEWEVGGVYNKGSNFMRGTAADGKTETADRAMTSKLAFKWITNLVSGSTQLFLQ